MNDSLPTTIGRFEIRRELGRGAMGVVYEAHDPTLERLVALKVIQLGFTVPPEERASFEKRFLTEARAAARLAHPGIVVVHDVGRGPDSEALFMALEFLQGRTLAEVVATEAPLEWRRALRITGQIARALNHAHEHGIVHRDVKPANVMLLPDDAIKVMDFGIAKLQASHAHLTSTGQFFGTPLYMSPEQALGEAVDGRSDLFSLGVICYQLLTGEQLFEADSVPRIVTKVAYEPATPPSQVAIDLRPEVDRVVLTMLEKSPDERYRDGNSLAEDIDHVLLGEAPQNAPVPTGRSLGAATVIAGSVTPDAARSSPVAPSPAPETPRPARTPQARRSDPPTAARPHARGRRLMLGSLIALAGAAATGLWWYSGRSIGPIEGRRVAAPATATRPATPRGTPRSPPAAPTPEPTTVAPSQQGPSQLAIDFEHHYKDGTLQVWVDGEPVVSEELGARVLVAVGGLEVRQGSVATSVEVEPGRREVRVEVRWDENTRSGVIPGTFRPGRTRTLRIRIDRIRRKMSLDWI